MTQLTLFSMFSGTVDEETDEDLQEPAPKKKKERSFQSKWKTEFSWLEYNNDTKGMFCTDCVKFNKRSAFSNGEGCKNFRVYNLRKHEKSGEHQAALECSMMESSEGSLTSIWDREFSNEEKAVKAAMVNVYWLAKEEVATVKYVSLNNLVMMQGCVELANLHVARNAQYTHHRIAEEMQDCISICIEEHLLERIKLAPSFNLLIDESTDISTEKHLIVYVSFCGESGKCEVHYIANLMIKDGSAISIEQCIEEYLTEKGLPLSSCFGLCTDGASVMTGEEGGVAGLLKLKNPYLLSVHCIAHRLALATSQAADKVSYLQKYTKCVSAIYSHFSRSATRLSTLREIQDVINDPKLAYQQIYAIRWLSFQHAIEAIQRTLPSLITYFENEEAEGDPTAVGLTRELTSFVFLATTYLLVDALALLGKLSKTFQSEKIDFSVIPVMVDGTISTLSAMKDSPGSKLREFFSLVSDGKYKDIDIRNIESGRAKFCSVRGQFLQAVVDNLRARFPSLSLFAAMSILDPRNLPRNAADVGNYGDTQLDTLLNHFGSPKSDFPPPVDSDNAKVEWSLLKQVAFKQYKNLNVQEFLEQITKKHSNIVPELCKLTAICCSLPISTACCERGFSTQNRIKTRLRNRLSLPRLDVLMRISIESPSIENFNFDEALDKWRRLKPRRIFNSKK